RHIIYTVVGIGVAWGVYTATTAWVREIILLLGGLWSVGVTVILIMLSDNMLGDQLLYALMPMIMFGVLVQRQRFPYALAYGVGLMVMHTMATTTLSAENYLPGGTSGLVATVVLFTLMAGYAIEKETRKNYLTSLREEMRRHSLEQLTLLDPLTVIGNRRALEQRLQELGDHGILHNAAVIFADIDHFKRVNDGWGHDVGDRVLKEFATRLSQC
ncbi:MAG: GGDEF domain-containing protein, partial [Anaerolineales bacterium]